MHTLISEVKHKIYASTGSSPSSMVLTLVPPGEAPIGPLEDGKNYPITFLCLAADCLA